MDDRYQSPDTCQIGSAHISLAEGPSLGHAFAYRVNYELPPARASGPTAPDLPCPLARTQGSAARPQPDPGDHRPSSLDAGVPADTLFASGAVLLVTPG